ATSQFRLTVSTVFVEPRSTCHHWLSANDDDQRVVELPSFAFAGPSAPVSDADAVRLSATSAATAAVTADDAGCESPAPFVAVTWTPTVLPMSPWASRYVWVVAPAIGWHALPPESQRCHW